MTITHEVLIHAAGAIVAVLLLAAVRYVFQRRWPQYAALLLWRYVCWQVRWDGNRQLSMIPLLYFVAFVLMIPGMTLWWIAGLLDEKSSRSLLLPES